jgi:hypothetical protein
MTKSEKIARAIKYTAFAKKNPSDAKDVNFYLNAGDKITQQQLDDYHAGAASVVAEPEPWLAPEPASVEQDPEALGQAEAKAKAKAFNSHRERQRAPAPEPVEPEGMTEAEVIPLPLSVAAAQRRLIESQVRLRTAIDRQRECRGRIGIAIQKWQQAIGAIVTAEDNVRQHLASEAQKRADRAAGRIPARSGRARPGPSVIDQIAAGTAGAVYGNRGGAFAYKRGAMGLAQSQVALNRMAAARKLPSER